MYSCEVLPTKPVTFTSFPSSASVNRNGSATSPLGNKQWAVIGVHLSTGVAWRFPLTNRPLGVALHQELSTCVLLESSMPTASSPRAGAGLPTSFLSCNNPFMAVEHPGNQPIDLLLISLSPFCFRINFDRFCRCRYSGGV
jgi:hypothetical protein